MSTSQSPNDIAELGSLQFRIHALEHQLAEAQQAREAMNREVAESLASAGKMVMEVHAERDSLRGLLREALALIRVAHHWDKLSEVRGLCERITAALKEVEG